MLCVGCVIETPTSLLAEVSLSEKKKRHFALVGLFLNFTCLFSPTVFSSGGLVGGGDEVGERLAL